MSPLIVWTGSWCSHILLKIRQISWSWITGWDRGVAIFASSHNPYEMEVHVTTSIWTGQSQKPWCMAHATGVGYSQIVVNALKTKIREMLWQNFKYCLKLLLLLLITAGHQEVNTKCTCSSSWYLSGTLSFQQVFHAQKFMFVEKALL